MQQKISCILVTYHEEKLIRRCLDSVKDVVDEILVLHDGPCSDNTLNIAREYTSKVFSTKKNTGVPGPILPILFRKAKGPWILKLDSDEFLSEGMKKNLKKLVNRKGVNAYTFRWPYWDKNKYITKNWPRKLSLYRRDSISYIGFPHWDDPQVKGTILETDFHLEHRPPGGSALPTWKIFKEKVLQRYAGIQAEYTLKDVGELDSFQADMTHYPPLHFRLRRTFPLLSAVPIAFLSFFKTIFKDSAFKEGYAVLHEALQSFVYYLYLGYLVHRLKQKKSN